MQKDKIAVFIDAENLTKWIKEAGHEDLISDLGLSGQIITRRAYGVWSQQNLIPLQPSLNQLGFELIHCFHPVSGKNSTDIQMTVDIMEHALRLHDVEWFVLATGDSDFSPLFRKLREMGKEVIGVGPKSPLSESVKTSCSRYIYTDSSSNNNILDYDIAAELVEKILNNQSEAINLSLLKNSVLNSNSAFNEKDLGFTSFLQFVTSIDSVKCYKIESNNGWYAELSKTNINNSQNTNQSPSISATLESYTRILRSRNWRIVSRDTIYQLNSKLRKAPKSEKIKLTEYLLSEMSSVRSNITATEIRKALAIFIKSGLLIGEDNLWQYTNDHNYRSKIDQAIILRLLSGCKDSNIKFDLSTAKELLYENYTTEEQLNEIYRSTLHEELQSKGHPPSSSIPPARE